METIVLSEEHTRLEVPADLSAFEIIQLRELSVELEGTIDNIICQLGEHKQGTLPGYMMTDDWRKRAQGALSYFKYKLARVKLESAKKQEKNRRAKAERVAAEHAASLNGTDKAAFIDAARMVLSRDVYLSIWKMARDTYPEAFCGGKE